ncbi:MAG: adenylosuccinate lyase [Candidatus Pacebacteria bacterium]|nr:adenylosuccinate lyase [Candidatus Paceibacterota bacterium]
MLERYTLKEMGEIWSDENKFRQWTVVEVAVLEARHMLGELDYPVPQGLADAITIDPEEIKRIEDTITHHDMVAYLAHISPQFPEELRPWVHRGLTSYDIEDTALSLMLAQSIRVLLYKTRWLMVAIEAQAKKYKYTPEIGRTHGIHAEPITFGVKLANWHAEFERHQVRLENLLIAVSVGKISGAVGMYTLDPKVEKTICNELRLHSIIATQIISRDIIAEYMAVLGNLAASISKIAMNIRLLSETEIGEVMEPFGKNQKGSSAMPHKRNPSKSEQLCGLMRVPWNNVGIAYQNLANCWHERSLDNSSAERVTVADSSIAVDYGLTKLADIIEKMNVFPERMEKNISLTKGLIFSQDVMMLVAEKSQLPREEAHTFVRDIAIKCADTGEDFLKALLKSKTIMRYVTEEDLRSCFEIEKKLIHVDYIFSRVFPSG